MVKKTKKPKQVLFSKKELHDIAFYLGQYETVPNPFDPQRLEKLLKKFRKLFEL